MAVVRPQRKITGTRESPLLSALGNSAKIAAGFLLSRRMVRSGGAALSAEAQRLLRAELRAEFLPPSSSAPLVYWLGCLCSLAAEFWLELVVRLVL